MHPVIARTRLSWWLVLPALLFPLIFMPFVSAVPQPVLSAALLTMALLHVLEVVAVCRLAKSPWDGFALSCAFAPAAVVGDTALTWALVASAAAASAQQCGMGALAIIGAPFVVMAAHLGAGVVLSLLLGIRQWATRAANVA